MNGERGDGCAYEPLQRSYRVGAGVPPTPRDTPSRPPLSDHTLQVSKPPAAGLSFSEPVTRPLDAPLLTLPNPSKSTSLLLRAPPPSLTPYERGLAHSSRLHGEMELDPSSDVSVAQDSYDTTESAPHPPVPFFTVLPSTHFQAVPRPLQVPLSLIPPERVQISPIAGGDLCMTLYVIFRLLNSQWFFV